MQTLKVYLYGILQTFQFTMSNNREKDSLHSGTPCTIAEVSSKRELNANEVNSVEHKSSELVDLNEMNGD